jgi:ABC-type bacteriocin/lantibiotic exporter with double-glycine peptidase domain
MPEESKDFTFHQDFEHKDFEAKVEIIGVDFKHREQTSGFLENISLKINQGEFIGIVGPSGAGKSTFVDLILGILKPDKGEIRISGKEVSTVVSKWPGAIAYVPQEANLISGDIKTNICLGYDPSEVPDKYVVKILESVSLDEFTTSPNRLFQDIGERGNKLSGGQRQRLGLARALFTSPRLLVLDEATSSLDANTEKMVTDYLLTRKGEITMIVIAHRLSTVMQADRLIYIQDGKIHGYDTFENLRAAIPEFDMQASNMGL